MSGTVVPRRLFFPFILNNLWLKFDDILAFFSNFAFISVSIKANRQEFGVR